MKINQKDFIQQLVDERGYTKKSATMIVSDFTDLIIKNLENGNSVSIRGFGCFDIIERKARSCANPQTGERCDIPAHFVPRFFAGNYLRFAVKKWVAKQFRGGRF